MDCCTKYWTLQVLYIGDCILAKLLSSYYSISSFLTISIDLVKLAEKKCSLCVAILAIALEIL